jgi:hypothetical protein
METDGPRVLNSLSVNYSQRSVTSAVGQSLRSDGDMLTEKMKAAVGERDAGCRTDDFHHGSPGIDPRSLPPKPRDIYVRDLQIGSIKQD